MKSRQLEARGQTTWVLVFEAGDEVVKTLTSFAKENRISSASFTAVGAFSDVTLGFFQPDRKNYRKIPIEEQVEVLSLAGNIAAAGNQPKVHAHVVVGKSDGTAHGGHLLEGFVRPTLELVLTATAAPLERKFDPRVGLALIDARR